MFSSFRFQAAFILLFQLSFSHSSPAVDWKVTRTVTTSNYCQNCCAYQYQLCLKGSYQVDSGETKIVKKTYYEEVKVGTRQVSYIDRYEKSWNQQTCRWDRKPIYATRTEGVYEDRAYTKNVRVKVLETIAAHCFDLVKTTAGYYTYEFQGHNVPYGKHGSYFRSDSVEWNGNSMTADWGDSRHEANALPLARAIESVINNFGKRR